jgi:hypothetical protein
MSERAYPAEWRDSIAGEGRHLVLLSPIPPPALSFLEAGLDFTVQTLATAAANAQAQKTKQEPKHLRQEQMQQRDPQRSKER